MEITLEEEMRNQNPSSKCQNEFVPPKVIKVYPWDDDEEHLVYIVKPEDFETTLDLLCDVYEYWDTERREKWNWGLDELESECERILEMHNIFRVKFRYENNYDDVFREDELI